MLTTLKQLKPGESGMIRSIGGNSNLRHRLISMGVTPGACLTVRKLAPLGDPMEIRIRNYALVIRQRDAQEILVERIADLAAFKCAQTLGEVNI
ncbi:MAG: ferrous iron transport protein A [Ruminococcaceae bacterium]|nr:ferrous iron transport protein A [Oscillospiraceae bacterium]